MYSDFFGLRCRPFEDRADPRFFYATSDGHEALAVMEYEARFGKGLALILGDTGTGKTLLIRTLLQRLHATDHVVVLTCPGGGSMNVLRETCKAYGVTLPRAHKDERCLARLRRHLARTKQSDHRSILIVDQVEHMTVANMGELARLTELQADDQPLISVLLVGQPQFRKLLDREEFASLRQRLFGQRVLARVAESETQAYIAHRLDVAGIGDANIFDSSVIPLIHRAAEGIPRLINRICHEAMLAAYGAGVARVDIGLIVDVISTIDGAVQSAPAAHLASAPETSQTSDSATTQHLAAINPTETHDRVPTAAAGDRATVPSDIDSVTDSARYTPTWPAADAGAAPWVPTNTESFAAGEALLDRLDRAVARAERVTATTDATVARHTAVEKHLASLTDSAERLVARIAGTAQTADQSLGKAQRRISEMVSSAEDRLKAIDEGITRASDMVAQTQDQTDALMQAREEADRARDQLTSFAEQLADKADEVQDRVALLMNEVASSDSASARLGSLMDRLANGSKEAQVHITNMPKIAEQTLADLNRSAATLRTSMTEINGESERAVESAKSQIARLWDQAERSYHELDNAALTRLREQSTAIAGDAEARYGKLKATIEADRREMEGVENSFRRTTKVIAADTVGEIRKQLEELARASETQIGTLKDAVSADRSEMEEVANSCRRTVKEIVAGAADNVAAMREQVGDMARASEAQFQTLKDAVDAERVEIENTANVARETAADTVAYAKTEITRVRDEVADLERCIGETSTAAGDVGHIVDDVGQRIHGFRGSVDAMKAEITDLTDRAETSRHALRTVVDDAGSRFDKLNGVLEKVDAVRHDLSRSLLDIGGAFERLTAMREHSQVCTGLADRLDAARAAGQQTLQQLGDAGKEAEQNLANAVRSAEDVREHDRLLVEHCEGACETIERLGRIDEDGNRLLARLTERIDGAEQVADVTYRLEELVGTGRQIHDALNELIAHTDQKIGLLESRDEVAARTLDGLTQANANGTQLVERIESSASTNQATLTTLENQLARIQTACDRADATRPELEGIVATCTNLRDTMRQLIDESQDQSKRLDAQAIAGGNILRELNDTNRSGHELVGTTTKIRNAFDKLIDSTDRKFGLLESRDEAAGHTLESLALAAADGSQLVERIETTTSSNRTILATLEEQITRIKTTCDRADTARPELEEIVATCRQLRDTMRKLGGESENRIERLDAQATAGGTVLRELTEVNEQSHELVTQLTKASVDVPHNAKQIEDLIREVWDLTTRTEVCARDLARENDRSESVLAKLKSGTEPAEQLVTVLDESVGRAESHAAVAASQTAEVTQLAERIDVIASMLTTARDIEASIARGTHDARNLIAQLHEHAEDATQHGTTLRDLNAAAVRSIESMEQMQADTADAAEQLQGVLSETHDAVKSGKATQGDWSEWSEKAANQLIELQRRTKAMEQLMAQAATKPVKILAEAQAQAVQLERVCTAVRKVFGGLSEATLQATRQTKKITQQAESIQKIRDEAGQQLGALTSESNQAVQTLSEWVDEAVRAQTRLARTLERTPSISETHPGHAITRRSGLQNIRTQLATTIVPGELTTLDEPTDQTPHQPTPHTKLPARAQEMARLLDEAKQQPATPR